MSLAAEQRFERIVAGESLSGAFFFHGDAERLRDEAARRLADAALDPATRDFNINVYRGADVSPESLAAALAMAPMMAPRRVVVLYEAERLTPNGCKVVENVLEKLPGRSDAHRYGHDPGSFEKGVLPAPEGRGRQHRMVHARGKPNCPAGSSSERIGATVCGSPPMRRRPSVSAVGAELGVLDAELAKLAAAASDVEPWTWTWSGNWSRTSGM